MTAVHPASRGILRPVSRSVPPPHPPARSVVRAFDVLDRLEPEVLLDYLVHRLIGHLDAGTPDPDLEPEETDDDDQAEEDPLSPSTLRPERDGFVRVWRKPARFRTTLAEVAS